MGTHTVTPYGCTTSAKDFVQIMSGTCTADGSAAASTVTYSVSGMTSSDKLLMAINIKASGNDTAGVVDLMDKSGCITDGIYCTRTCAGMVVFLWLKQGA